MRIHRWLVAILACALAGPWSTAGAQRGPATDAKSEPRLALVIGNSEYKGAAALKNPVNDASDMAKRLEVLGFDVLLKLNATQREMYRSITEFGSRIRPGGIALVFYAGHGIQAKGRNFLIPVDAQIETEPSLRSEGVDVDQLLAQLAPARVSLVILDACRNNPFERGFRGREGSGLAQIDAPKGTLIAYSTAPGRVAADGDGRNSPYAGELLRALEREERRVEDLFKEVRVNVAKATADQQIPWESSSLTGELLIGVQRPQVVSAPKADPSAASAAPSAPSPGAEPAAGVFELAFWNSIRDSASAAEYKAYLDQFPDGRFAGLARARIRQLSIASASPQVREPQFQPSAPPAQAATASVTASAPAPAPTRPAAPRPDPAPVPPIASAAPAPASAASPAALSIPLFDGKTLRLPSTSRWVIASTRNPPMSGSTVRFHRFPESFVRRGESKETVVQGEVRPGLNASVTITAPSSRFFGVISWDAPRCGGASAQFAENFAGDFYLPECLYLREERDARDTPIYEIGYHRYVSEAFVSVVARAPAALWADRDAAIAWGRSVAISVRELLKPEVASIELPTP